ncbi:MAG: hypothetical protein HOA20_06730 [Rhodobacterales bacterium]|jgi:hypothetical protein|nr:hypothetical protein [Rhodobacterales bacterium]MCO4796167.1 hypothetical protein [Amylibacter sp.]
MRGILISSFIFILLSGCEEIPAPVNTSTILVKPLAEMIETTLNLDNAAQEAEVPENDTMIDEEVETVAPPEGLYEPVLSLPGGNEASKQAIVIKKIREITLKKRTKTLNLFEYSASQGQSVGEQVYDRPAIWYENGSNCHEYSVPEIAQMAFLSSGGPQRDTLLLDADGDGFACSWVPIR